MRVPLAVMTMLTVASTAQAQFKSAVLKPLTTPALMPLTPRVMRIRADPPVLTLHVGQTVPLTAITVVVIDSSGKELGRLTGFDFGIPPGSAAQAVPQKVTGAHPGTAQLTIHYPREAWKSRTDARPAAVVRIDVKP